MKWHYTHQDEQHGPVTDEEIKGLIAGGNITPDNLVWCEGMAGWEPVSNVPELMPAGNTTGVAAHAAPAAVGSMSAYVEDSTLSQAVVYSGFWRRVAASLIDSVILSFVGVIVGIIWGVAMVAGGISDTEVVELTGNVVGLFLGWLYYALMESSSKQGTIGKQVMGIRVTDLEGNQISFARASGRHFGKIISSLILLIGYLMMLWTEKKQTLHDMMAGCLVVKSN
ncbi:MAG: RDD family protein [Akkermansiaceae bacterium]